MGDERACQREIRESPKAIQGKAGRHGPKDYATLPGEISPVHKAREKSAEAIVAKKTFERRRSEGLKSHET